MAGVGEDTPISEFLAHIDCRGDHVPETLRDRAFHDVSSLRVYVNLLGGNPETRMEKLHTNLGLPEADAAKIMTFLIATGLS